MREAVTVAMPIPSPINKMTFRAWFGLLLSARALGRLVAQQHTTARVVGQPPRPHTRKRKQPETSARKVLVKEGRLFGVEMHRDAPIRVKLYARR